MNKPNFFIIGAQKTGTTALSEYLRTHPNLVLSLPKEPHFFSDEFKAMCPVRSLAEYQMLFDSNKANVLACGEASTGYLQSESAVARISDYNPRAKIIVMLRNPTDLVQSLHAHLLYHGHEDEPSFDRAWSLQGDRQQGRQLPKDPRLHVCLQYRKVMKIGSQLQRVMNYFPSDQVKVIIFDDFIEHPHKIYSETLRFLGLPEDARQLFPKINSGKYLRFPNFTCGYRRRIPWKIRRVFRNKYTSELFRLLMTSKPTHRHPISSETYTELQEISISEIAILTKILNRDLSAWIKQTF